MTDRRGWHGVRLSDVEDTERGRVRCSVLTTGEWREGGERCEGRKSVWMGRKGIIWWGSSGGERGGASEGGDGVWKGRKGGTIGWCEGERDVLVCGRGREIKTLEEK